MMAHDGVSWQVMRSTFEFADDFQMECKINEALATGIRAPRSLIVEHFTE